MLPCVAVLVWAAALCSCAEHVVQEGLQTLSVSTAVYQQHVGSVCTVPQWSCCLVGKDELFSTQR
jgi:hypothetical protein